MTTTTRPPRRVVSFVRRSARMRGPQQRAWESHRGRYLVPVERADTSTSVAARSALDLPRLFGRTAPLVVEIGPGSGEALVAAAEQRPEANFLAFEVHEPSLAQLVKSLADHDLTNVRLVEADAVAGLRRLLPADSIEELWTYFPDPWPKARHHKRRLVNQEFADLVAARMKRDGRWRLATDWAPYAEWIHQVLDAHPGFVADPHVGRTRVETRFERRGLAAGRRISDLGYRRR